MASELMKPYILGENDQFLLKLAENQHEVDLAFRLRYKVFNIEQGKGLDLCGETGVDKDEFDDYCIHLIVVEKKTGNVVGTYRIHIGKIAKASEHGFYSAREYNIHGLDKIADQCLEVGRSCVANQFRTGSVVSLLWEGLCKFLKRSNLRFLFGCASLESTDPVVAWALYRYFQEKNLISERLSAEPVEKFLLEKPSEKEIEKAMENRLKLIKEIPPLLKGYFRLGTKICGEPALDYEFGTIDYLILLDLKSIPERYLRHFE